MSNQCLKVLSSDSSENQLSHSHQHKPKIAYFLSFPEIRLKCPRSHCEYIAANQGQLVAHFRIHPKARLCHQCKKQFGTIQNLIKHSRLHTKERPYPCPVQQCRWAYKQKGDLLAHIGRGKHGIESDNNRPPPKYKFYNGQTTLPLLVCITADDIIADPNLKQKIQQLREREEKRKCVKRKNAEQRKSDVDDIGLSIALAVYTLDSAAMKNLLAVMQKKHQMRKKLHTNKNERMKSIKSTKLYSDSDVNRMPRKKRKAINRVYGNYSIVLAPAGSLTGAQFGDPSIEQCVAKTNHKKNHCRIHPKNNTEAKNLLFESFSDKKQNIIYNYNNKRISQPPIQSKNSSHGKKSYKLSKAISGYWECHAPGCGSQYITRDLLTMHMEYMHGPGIYGCKWCHRLFRSHKNAQNHIIKNHQQNGDNYIDAIIYNEFTRVAQLKSDIWQRIKCRLKNYTCNEKLSKTKEIHVKFTIDKNTENMEFAEIEMKPIHKKCRKRKIKNYEINPKLAEKENIPLLHLLTQMQYESQKKDAILKTNHLKNNKRRKIIKKNAKELSNSLPSIIPPFISSLTPNSIYESEKDSTLIKSEIFEMNYDLKYIPIKTEINPERDPLLSSISEDEEEQNLINLNFGSIPQFSIFSNSNEYMQTPMDMLSSPIQQRLTYDMNSPSYSFANDDEMYFDMRSLHESAYMPLIQSPNSYINNMYVLSDNEHPSPMNMNYEQNVNEKTFRRCNYCGIQRLKNGRSLLLCGHCLAVCYCGKNCQSRDYPCHRFKCNVLKKRKVNKGCRENIRML